MGEVQVVEEVLVVTLEILEVEDLEEVQEEVVEVSMEEGEVEDVFKYPDKCVTQYQSRCASLYPDRCATMCPDRCVGVCHSSSVTSSAGLYSGVRFVTKAHCDMNLIYYR